MFVWTSIQRKGVWTFLRDRASRLGIPFLVVAVVLSPISYYPTYLLTGAPSGFSNYVKAWMALGRWPTGPAWFLWVLLVFDGIAVILYVTARPTMERVSVWWTTVSARSVSFFFGLSAASVIAYGTMAHLFGVLRWFSFGLFQLQAARVLLYFLFFLTGMLLGVTGHGFALFTSTGNLARRWRLWAVVAVVMFALEIVSTVASAPIATAIFFAVSCTSSSLFLLAVFSRFGERLDWQSLNRSAYGIYLVHYTFVTWLQYALVRLPLPALIKFAAVLTGAIGMSWATAVGLRRIPIVRRVL